MAVASELNVNLGFEGSTRLIQEAVGHNICGNIKEAIRARSKDTQSRRDLSKSPEYKRRRVLQRASKYRLYEQKQIAGGSFSHTYETEIAINSK